MICGKDPPRRSERQADLKEKAAKVKKRLLWHHPEKIKPEEILYPTQVDKRFGVTEEIPARGLKEPSRSGFQKKRRFLPIQHVKPLRRGFQKKSRSIPPIQYVDCVESRRGGGTYFRPDSEVTNAYKNLLLCVLALEGPSPCRLEPSPYYKLDNLCLVDATYVEDMLNNTVNFQFMALPPCRIPILTLYNQFVDKDCERKDRYDVPEEHIDMESLFHVVAGHFKKEMNVIRLLPLVIVQIDDSEVEEFDCEESEPSVEEFDKESVEGSESSSEEEELSCDESSSEEEEFDDEISEESAEEFDRSNEESAEDSESSYSDEDEDASSA